ncbi:MAG: hypothetical protein AAGF56_05190 [Pseudomonadota bacterium]
MTKLSICFSAAVLSISLAPAVQAYATDPEAQDYAQLATISVLPQAQVAEDTCTVKVTPALVAMLGLPDDWRGQAPAGQETVACAK